MELIKIDNHNQNGQRQTVRSTQSTNTQKKTAQGTSRTKRAPKQGKGKRFFFGFMRFIGVCICLGVMVVSVASVLLSMYVVEKTADDGTLLDLTNLKLNYTTTIFAKGTPTEAHPDGEDVEYKRLVGEENRVWVDINDIPENLQNAFIAIEDKNFYTHKGFSIKRTVFAGLSEVSHMLTGKYLGNGTKQGASTIDQQLIKNITNDEKQDYGRKIREIFRAIALDGRFSKQIILEAYLNTISLTGNVAGVQAGAHSYFNKEVGDLTLAECATIASITKDPTGFHPGQNPERNKERRDQVLYEMYTQGLIKDEADYKAALAAPLILSEKKDVGNSVQKTYTSYAQDKVIEDVVSDMQTQLGLTREEATRMLYNDGLQIYSTIDVKLQNEMERVMRERKSFPEFEREIEKKGSDGKVILGDDGKPVKETVTIQGAMITINTKGELCATVGGFGEKEGDRTFSRSTDMRRAVGSTMKGVTVYPTALDCDLINYSSTFMDDVFKQIPDEKTGEMIDWPTNYNPGYSKKLITVEQAVKESLNTIAVRVGYGVTPRTMFDFAYDTLQVKSLDIQHDVDLAPMCLGALTKGMTPYELAGAYMMYGNKGEYITPHSYTSVVNAKGEVILEPDVMKVQAIGEDTAYIMNRLLKNVLGAGGTAPGLATKTSDSIGKTGTTNENKDIWYVGITPQYTTATWFGYDANEEIKGYNAHKIKHPGAVAWRDLMDTVQEGTTHKDFEVSENVEVLPFCKASGANPGPLCPEVGQGYYKKGTTLGTCTAEGHF
ncbi:MAG: transglycosylase domain-containing protein [Oscillospiraceae bacterium]